MNFSYILSATIWMGSLIAPVQTSAASLVELYTSQGCSSCPRADLYMTELANRDDVIPLSFHVDYWDYLGWKDEMASPLFSERQVKYQQARQEKQIYTPQVIVNGRHSFSGANTEAIETSFKLNRVAEGLTLSVMPNQKLNFSAFEGNGKSYEIMIAHLLPPTTVEITAGQNEGKLIEYTNVVKSLEKLADWDALTPMSVSFKADVNSSLVVFVQEAELGAVVFAEKLNY